MATTTNRTTLTLDALLSNQVDVSPWAGALIRGWPPHEYHALASATTVNFETEMHRLERDEQVEGTHVPLLLKNVPVRPLPPRDLAPITAELLHENNPEVRATDTTEEVVLTIVFSAILPRAVARHCTTEQQLRAPLALAVRPRGSGGHCAWGPRGDAHAARHHEVIRHAAAAIIFNIGALHVDDVDSACGVLAHRACGIDTPPVYTMKRRFFFENILWIATIDRHIRVHCVCRRAALRCWVSRHQPALLDCRVPHVRSAHHRHDAWAGLLVH